MHLEGYKTNMVTYLLFTRAPPHIWPDFELIFISIRAIHGRSTGLYPLTIRASSDS